MPISRNLRNYRSRNPRKTRDFGFSFVNFGSSSMGLRQSKEELLYNHAINGQIEEIKALHRDGASLEWFDKERRTPLIMSSMNPQLYDVAKTLIELGANVNAYRPGSHAGTALHHAAKKGLERTVKLLLSHGANALARNDDCQTPLDVARVKGHTNVVRTIESHICFFSGWLRELYGPGFLDALVRQLLSRKIWVVVVPCGSRNPRKPLKLQLAMYTSLQDAQPRTTITLWKAKVEEPKFSQPVPVMNIFDKATRTRYKLASSDEGAKQQLQWLCNACRGIPQVHPTVLPNSHTPATPPSNAEDVELAMAINASLQSSMEERPPLHDPYLSSKDRSANGWGSSLDNSSHNGWVSAGGPAPSEASSSGWLDEPPVDAYNGWGAPETGNSSSITTIQEVPGTASSSVVDSANNPSHNGWGPVEGSRSPSKDSSIGWSDEAAEVVNNGWSTAGTGSRTNSAQNNNAHMVPITHEVRETTSVPSAPPVPEGADYGPIHYPPIDLSPVGLTVPNMDDKEARTIQVKEDSLASSSCVICLDAPVEGACVPCGHMAGCMSCLSEVKGKKWGCPVCRSKIEQVIRLYAV